VENVGIFGSIGRAAGTIGTVGRAIGAFIEGTGGGTGRGTTGRAVGGTGEDTVGRTVGGIVGRTVGAVKFVAEFINEFAVESRSSKAADRESCTCLRCRIVSISSSSSSRSIS
jgi:hypothetical protein